MKKILVSSLRGLEDVCILEAKSILNVKAKKIFDGNVVFETNSVKKYLNKVRVANRVGYFIKKFEFKSKKDLLDKINKIKFDFKGSFKVECQRKGKHTFNSGNVEREVGGVIFKKGYKIDIKKPKNIIFVEIIDDVCIISLLIQDKLCKRPYRFKRSNSSIDSCMAASLSYLGDIKKNHVVVNPECKDGIVGIEFYLQGIKKISCFDSSLNNIRNSLINTKLAKAKIEFSNRSLRWLDTLFDEKSVDRCVIILSYSSRKEEIVKKDFDELLNQMKHVLKKNGMIIIVGIRASKLKAILKGYPFKIEKEKSVFMGNEEYNVLILEYRT